MWVIKILDGIDEVWRMSEDGWPMWKRGERWTEDRRWV